MITTKKQSAGDHSVNYMAEGDINIHNGLSKEEILALLKQLSEKTEIESEELVATRKSVKDDILPYFIENKKIFDTYGPMTDERFNPESEMPEIWLRKIQEFILPNNEEIVELINTHKHLLLEWELEVFAEYKQHVDDFSAKHTGLTKTNGTMFPAKILSILE
ncbi:hypothetical protein [Vibrio splendidus]|uniref:Uncharacterized protein n=1 Tax=Vibrio splendidus TaxID=29497 RepID=A0A2T5E8K0_VIBSP|nr:hypothetical protein [Vibrio splendidus]OEE57650.1 hypothetical protein A147_22735 [Vibrio splendidus FF-6]PTP15644.1 hypothetical protein CWO36_19750 [Vibrio splendidus]